MEHDDEQGCCSKAEGGLEHVRAADCIDHDHVRGLAHRVAQGVLSETDALNAADSRIDFAERIVRPRAQLQSFGSAPPALDMPLRLAADPCDPARASTPRTTKVGGR